VKEGDRCSILDAGMVIFRRTLVPVGVLQALWVGVGAVAAGLAVDQHLRHRLHAYHTSSQHNTITTLYTYIIICMHITD
jgi:hypothetical protein